MSHIFRNDPSKLSIKCQLIRGSEMSTLSCRVITNNSAKSSSEKNPRYKSLVSQVLLLKLFKCQTSTRCNGLLRNIIKVKLSDFQIKFLKEPRSLG